MLHVSTRGEAPHLGFADALLAGLARDGGLYVPATWPAIAPAEIAGFAGRPYAAVAERVVGALADGDIAPAPLARMIGEACATFRHAATCPLVQIGDNLFVLELFHGPTLAFKDVAMQLLGRLMDHFLAARGERATIVGATSGDTGGAAIEAFRGCDRVDVVILYPQGRVSAVQRRQMTTVDAPHVRTAAVEGTFDDCQNLVKAMFNHHAFRDEVRLTGVNSINWARIAAQVVYYFTAAVALGAPRRKVSFAVPTGNFGDVLAGYVAGRMGLPIDRLMIGTNDNDILARTLATGAYEMRGVTATTSPSMDIQISSNFERLLFELHDRDGAIVRRLMQSLAQSGRFALAEAPLARLRALFDARAVPQTETAAVMAETLRTTGYLADPHTAIGIAAGHDLLARDPATPAIVLGTAHPAKFPEAVRAATGVTPRLPAHLADLMERAERTTVLPADQGAIEAFIRDTIRDLRGVAA